MNDSNLAAVATMADGSTDAVFHRVEPEHRPHHKADADRSFPGDETCPVVRANRIWLSAPHRGPVQVFFL